MTFIVVFLHGGPGGGVDPKDRQFFNPVKYKVCPFLSVYTLAEASELDCPF